MGNAHLSAEIWIIIALIVGLNAMICLGILASSMQRQHTEHRLRREVRDLRQHYTGMFGAVPAKSKKAA